MKFLLTLTLAIFLSLNSFAQSKTYSTKDYVNNDNYNNLNTLEDVSTNLNKYDSTLTKFETCQAKNKAYLGTSHDRADSDGCVDITQGSADPYSVPPTFAGFVPSYIAGDMFNTLDVARYGPDDICEYYFNQSRALSYDDLQFTFADLSRKPGDTSLFYDPVTGNSASALWLPGGIVKTHNNKFMLKNGKAVNIRSNADNGYNSCMNWTSTISSYDGLVLTPSGDFQIRSCNLSFMLACVYN